MSGKGDLKFRTHLIAAALGFGLATALCILISPHEQVRQAMRNTDDAIELIDEYRWQLEECLSGRATGTAHPVRRTTYRRPPTGSQDSQPTRSR